MTTSTQVTAFETGKTYFCRSACDHECVWRYTIAKRTAKTITTTEGKTLRINAKLTEYNQVETVMPKGSYSMAPILTADKCEVTDEIQQGGSEMQIKISSESSAIKDETIVTSIKAADEVLRTIALNRTPGGGYHKTFFEITIDDDTYSGRIDVHYINDRQETATGKLGLLEHIKTVHDYYTGSQCPSYVNDDYKQSLRDWYARLAN